MGVRRFLLLVYRADSNLKPQRSIEARISIQRPELKQKAALTNRGRLARLGPQWGALSYLPETTFSSSPGKEASSASFSIAFDSSSGAPVNMIEAAPLAP